MVVRPAVTRPTCSAEAGAQFAAEHLVNSVEIEAAGVGIDAAIVPAGKEPHHLALIIHLIRNQHGLGTIAEMTDGTVRRHRPTGRNALNQAATHLARAGANHRLLVEEAFIAAGTQ